jgi:DNA-binding LacI/PurR family transcriptional regulator
MDGYITISPHYVLPPEITNDAMRKAVVVCTMEPVGDYAAVTTDDEQGTYLAVKHLLDIGH